MRTPPPRSPECLPYFRTYLQPWDFAVNRRISEINFWLKPIAGFFLSLVCCLAQREFGGKMSLAGERSSWQLSDGWWGRGGARVPCSLSVFCTFEFGGRSVKESEDRIRLASESHSSRPPP